jgi:CBS domain-containing protein
MVKDRITVKAETSIDDAVQLMEEKRLLNLPVEKDGIIQYTPDAARFAAGLDRVRTGYREHDVLRDRRHKVILGGGSRQWKPLPVPSSPGSARRVGDARESFG